VSRLGPVGDMRLTLRLTLGREYRWRFDPEKDDRQGRMDHSDDMKRRNQKHAGPSNGGRVGLTL